MASHCVKLKAIVASGTNLAPFMSCHMGQCILAWLQPYGDSRKPVAVILSQAKESKYYCSASWEVNSYHCHLPNHQLRVGIIRTGSNPQQENQTKGTPPT